MKKSVLDFVIQVVVTAVIYACILWLFDGIFDHEWAFSVELLVQSAVFAILFVPLSRWMTKWEAKK